MSIHKLTAGSGYDYLTRQVAALDATAKGHVGLASYYTEHGESPGVWVGAGLAGIDGLEAGDAVTAEQMRALFGAGMHPLATQRLEQLRDADLLQRLNDCSESGDFEGSVRSSGRICTASTTASSKMIMKPNEVGWRLGRAQEPRGGN